MTDKNLLLEWAGECYGFSTNQAVPLSGGHFSMVYEFPRDDETFVLRITPPNGEINLSSMHATLQWLDYLASHGASISTPQHSDQGNLIESMLLGDELYILVAFKKVSGILAEDLFPEQWSDDLTTALGQTVGKMHAISRSYHPAEASLIRPAWDEIVNCFNPSEKLDDHHGLIARKQQEIRMMIQSLPKDEHSYGLIHTDLHFANFIVDPSTQTVTMIDFDDCACGWYMMDIAMLLLDSTVLYGGTGVEAYAIDFLRFFLGSYLRHNSLDLVWIRRLPEFLKLLEIGLYVMLYQQYNPDDHHSWVGRFMAGRRERIEKDLPYLDIDFAYLVDEMQNQCPQVTLDHD